MKTLRRYRTSLGGFMTALVAIWQIGNPLNLSAATFYWDADAIAAGNNATTGANLGNLVGPFTWNTTLTNWWDGVAGSDQAWVNGSNTAVFTGTSGTVTLATNITAGGLTFNTTGYTLTGGVLTLVAPDGGASPVIAVNNALGQIPARTEIGSVLAGTSGFTKTGNGTLVLSNSGNTFSGDVAIRQGRLVITDGGQLGTGTTAISVTGISQSGNPGYSGGSLVLQGGAAGASSLNGVTLNREVSVSGRGPSAVNNSGGLVSIGYNTLAGGLTLGATNSQTGDNRVWATHGATTISGDVYIGTTGANNVFQGNGNWIVSGQISGTENTNDRFIKSGQIISTTLWLQNNNNTFLQAPRVDSGTIRVGTVGALGLSTTSLSMDLQNGSFELRTDAPAGFATKNVAQRTNTSGNIFMDHDITGSLGISTSLQNQTVLLGTLRSNLGSGQTATFAINGRNGYGATFTPTSTGGAVHGANSAGDGNMTINVNTNGLVTFNGDMQFINSTTARNLTFGGNGDVTLNGNFIPLGVAAHSLIKSGTGTFTYNGTAGTYTGATNISAGTLAFSNVGGFAGTSGINIGNATTTSGALTYTGGAATLSNAINLNTTTANVYLNASGTGALTINGTISAVTGNKTLVLGGSNTGDNTITSVLPTAGGTLNLQKVGAGTWVLAPTSSNLFTGSTTISRGTLKLTDGAAIDILPDAGAVIFGVDALTQSAGGTLVYNGGANAEIVGALTGTMGHGIVTAASGTLTFASLGTRSAGGSINVSNTGTVNVGGTAGFLNAGTYFNGADFAYSGAGTTLRAAVYGTDAGFVNAAGALTGGSHNQMTGAITGQTTVTVNSLKISGAFNLDLDVGQTLTVGVAAGTGIIQTGGSSTISGGGGLAAFAAGNDFAIRVDGSGNTLTINTQMSGSTAGLTKSGDGTLVLGGANTYSGTVYVNEGTLQMGAGGLLGATGIGLAVRQGGIFDLNGVNVGTAASGTNAVNALNGAGTITNSGALASLRIGEGGAGGLFTGLITGNVALIKAGAGTTHLSGMNTFTGPVTLAGGNLDLTRIGNIGVASALGAGDATSAATNAASLVFNGGNIRYIGSSSAGAVEATQTPSVSTDRLFTLAGNGGIYSFGSYGAIVINNRTANNASLIFNNTGDVAFSGAGTRTLTLGGDSIGDNEMRLHLINNTNANEALSITKADGGLWILNPLTSNTYSGDTTISGGALRAMTTGAVVGISNTSLLTINGGVLETSGTFSRTLGNTAGTNQVRITGGSSGFAAANADRLVVTIGGGGLTWGSTNFNPTSLVLGSSTALGETEITNDINLNGANRTITTNTNGTTGAMVVAGILSGVISNSTGTAGITKNGGGALILGNDNTYNGNTSLADGFLFIGTVGNSTGTVKSSLGASGGSLNYTGDATLNLMYVGAGEVATRAVTIASTMTTARTYRLDSSGSGALVLENFTNNKSGNFALLFELRGANTDSNRINSVFGDGLAGGTQIIKNDGGIWSLGNTANTFTGGVRVDGGLLGLAANGSVGAAGFLASTTAVTTNTTTVTVGTTVAATLKPGMLVNGPGVGYGDYIVSVNAGAGTFVLSATRTIASGASLQFGGLIMSNGGIFSADGNALVLSQPVTFNNNAAVIFAGAGSITLNGPLQLVAGANDITLSNNLDGAAILTLNTNLVNNKSNDQTLNIRGFGSTVWDGVIANAVNGTNTTSLNISIANNASFTTKGAANTYTGITTLNQGTLILNKALGVVQIGNGTSQFNFGGGVLRSDAGALTGANALANNVFLTGDPATIDGANSIELSGLVTNNGGNRLLINNISGGTLTLSGNISLSNDGTGRTLTVLGSGNTTINGLVQNGGAAAGGLVYSGDGTLTLRGANTASGALTVNRGTVVLAGANGSWNTTGNTFILGSGSNLRLDNSVTENLNRMLDGGTITMNGGGLDFIGDANGTSETLGTMAVNSVMGTITMSGSGPNVLNFGTVNFANSGSSLDLTGIAGLGTTNKIMIGTLQVGGGAFSNAILPRAMILNDFTRYDTTNGIVAFSAYNNSNNLDTAVNGDTMNVTANAGLAANRTLNAIKINGSGLTVGTAERTLTLTAGALLNTGGNNTITAAQISLANQGFIQVDSGTILNVNAAFVNNSINKVGGGTLRLNAGQFYNTTTNVSGGTLILNGGLNTLFANGAGKPGDLNLDVGVTLDLNGNTQYVGAFGNGGSGLAGTAGTLTTTSGTPLFVTRDGGTFGGQITGTLNVGKIGANTLTFTNASSYTGTFSILGGALSLRDDGTLLNVTGVDVNYATLSFDNNSSLQTQNNNRINDTAGITLRGGNITYNGRVNAAASETLGALNLAQGANTVTASVNGSIISSVELDFGALTRSAGATINFTGTTLGQQGNSSRITFDSTPTLLGNGILGAWAIANTTDYAAYNAGQGVGIVGQGGYTGYSSQAISAASAAVINGVFASGNVTNLVSTANSSLLLSGGVTTTSLLRISGAFATDVLFTNGADVLNLELGGILRSNENFATTFGTTTTRGIITSGTNELIIYNAQNTLTINSVINGSATLVKDGAGTLTLTAANGYSLGTVVNRGTLNISPTNPGDIVIPGGTLTINGGVTGTGTTVNSTTAAGAIAAGTDLTINGRGTLTFGNGHTNTLNSVTLNNNGGEGNPTLDVGDASSVLNLSSGSITSTSSNAATTATIQDGKINLAVGINTFSVGGIKIGTQTYTVNQPALSISSIIAGVGSSITKSGDGILQLSGSNTFTGGVTTTGTSGGILLASDTNITTLVAAGLGANATAFVNGPVGTGTLTLAAGNLLMTNDASRTIVNNVVFQGDARFQQTGSATLGFTARTITLNGPITTPNGVFNINVDNPFLTVALQGRITNASLLTSVNKTGLGNLTINLTGASGTLPITMNDGGALSIMHDGDGDVQNDAINLGAITMTASPPTLTIGRSGQTVLWNQAVNKIITPTSFSSLANGLTLTANNGYGLLISDAVTLSTAGPTFNVGGGARNSNVVQNLSINGQITGGATGAGAVTFTKTGNGTLVLGNNATGGGANSFGGGGSILDITLGALSVASREALGNVGFIRLNANASTGSIFRVTGDMTLGAGAPRLQFGNATAANLKIVQVSEGKTLTLNNALDFSSFSDNLEFQDLGTTYFGANANNTGYGGRILLRGGVISVDNLTNANAFGVAGVGNTSGDLVVSASIAGTNASLNLSGGVSISEVITLGSQSGFNQTGAIRSVSGNNTITSQIYNGAAPFIGVDTGSTLSITGGFTGGGSLALTGGGTLNFTTTALSATTSSITLGRPTASNAGVVNIGVASSAYVGALTVNRGILNVGIAGVGSVGGAGAITLAGNGTLAVNDTTTAVANRLGGGRAISMQGGNFTYTANGAAVSSESLGTLTSAQGANTITLNNAGIFDATLTFAGLNSNTVGGGSVLTFSSLQTLNTSTNNVAFTALPTLTSGIIQRAVVRDGAGLNFATLNSSSVVAYFAYNNNGAYTDINSSTAADNVKVGTGFVTTDDLTAGKTINALYISGNGLTVDAATSNTVLAITSGNILASGGSNTLGSGLTLAFGGAEGSINVDTGSTLTVNGMITNSFNVTKGLDGNLIFNAKQQFNTGANYFTILGGTVTLNAGENTLYQGVQGGTAGQHLSVGFGATLNLNGNSQMVGDLRTPNNNGAVGGGGTITSSSAATFISGGGVTSTWGGQITGNIFFNKSGGNTQTFINDNTYTGGTLINGGAITLQDAGRLSGTSSIVISGGGLTLTNSGTIEMIDRVIDSAAITLQSYGVLILGGRDASNVTETLGNVTIGTGGGNIQVNNGAAGTIRSAELTIGNLIHSTDGGMLLINNPNGQMGNAGRLIIANGSSLMVNGIIPWINNGGADLVGYVAPTAGNEAGGLAPITQSGYQGYDGTVLPTLSNPTGNYKVGTAIPTLGAGGLNINALVLNSGVAQTIAFASNTDVLRLTAGQMIKTGNFNVDIGAAVDSGRFTVGGPADGVMDDFYLVVTAATANPVTINSRIIDNGTDKVRFIFTGYNTGAVRITNGQNSYTGGTVVNTTNGGNNGFMDLAVTGADGTTGNSAIPLATVLADSLIINGGNVRLQAANQINFAITPVLRGQYATLNLNNFNQTLAGLTFDNNGGSTAPTVSIGTGTLTLNGNVSAISSNAGSVSTITSGAGGTLSLNGAVRTFNIAPVTINGNTTVANLTPTLNISAVITGSAASGINKTGDGILQLSGSNTFTGPITVNAGTLKAGVATVAGVSGAFGVNTTITLANTAGAALDIATFNTQVGSISGGGALGGNLVLGAGATLTTGANNTSTTFAGTISGAGGFTKIGSGTMTLSGVHTYTGGTTVGGGTLKLDYTTNNSSKLSDTGVLTMSGGTLELSGGSHTETVLSTTLTAGTASNVTRTSGNSVLQMNLITVGALASINFSADNIATTDNTNVGGILGGWATVGGSDFAMNATDTPDGFIIAYDGYTNVNRLGPGNVIADGTANNVRIVEAGTTGNITLGVTGGITNINTLKVDETILGPAVIDPGLNETLRLGVAGGILLTNSVNTNALTIGTTSGDGSLTAGGNATNVAGAIAFSNFNNIYDITVNSNITNNGSGVVGVSKQGSGRVVLNGVNAFTGAIIVNEGTLQMGSSGSLVSAGNALTVSATAGNTASFDINGRNLTLTSITLGGSNNTAMAQVVNTGGSASITLNGTVTYNASNNPLGAVISANLNLGNNVERTFAVNNSTTAATDLTVSGNLTGTGTTGILKDFAGTLALAGTNTYTGLTTIRDGTLALQNGNAIADTARVHVIGNNGINATLRVDNSETIGALTGNGNVNIVSGQTLTVNSNATTVFNGGFTGAGTFKKTGTGTIELGGTSTGVINTEIAGGTALLRNPNALGATGSQATFAAGTTLKVSNAGFIGLRTTNGNWLTTAAPTLATAGAMVVTSAERTYTNDAREMGDNTGWIYTSIMQNPGAAGTWGFGEMFDDSAYLKLNGTQILNNGVYNAFTSGSGTMNAGDNVIDLRINNGTGGVGPVNDTAGSGVNWSVATPAFGVGYSSLGAPGSTQSNYIGFGQAYGAYTGTVATFKAYTDAHVAADINLGGSVTFDTSAMVDSTDRVFMDGIIKDAPTFIGAVFKDGNRDMVFTGVNTYSGTTTVNRGNLQIGNGGIGKSGTGAVMVNNADNNAAASVLSGTGIVQGAATVTKGTVKPGDAGGAGTGTLTFTNGLTYAAGSVTELQISGALSNDRINVSGGILTLDGGTTIRVLADGFTPQINTSYSWNLFDWVGALTVNGFSAGTSGRTGNNGDFNEGNLDLFDISSITGSTWDTSQFLATGVVSIVAVPEPSRVLLLMFGLMALCFRRRRRSSSLGV